MLSALRRDLDILPSPVKERPGLLIRDPMRYSDAVVIVPWPLTPCLDYFDGQHSESELRAELFRITGQIDHGIAKQLVHALQESAFLKDEHFLLRRSERERHFAESPVRAASQAGSGYPEEPTMLRETMAGYLNPADRAAGDPKTIGIAAPHVSPFGGWQSYRDAYRRLPEDAQDRTFIVLGTSHYGEPEKFGLTRKCFETPLGRASADLTLVDRLASSAPSAVIEEDYCHSVEHSIEFQVVFLQWLYGAAIRIVPVLCGAFVDSIYGGGWPEQNEGVARFIGALGEIAASQNSRLNWVLGVDMAHIGRRYGDAMEAQADQGYLTEVAERDRARNERITAGDSEGFWNLVQQNRDDLRWCGSSPFYTFLKAVPDARGRVERYQQWNIDEASVVTFAGISFTRSG